MAIDYGNYAGHYGGGIDTTAITQGIEKALERNKEARAGKISNFVDTWWDSHTKNFETAAFGDVDTWLKGTSEVDSAGVHHYTPLDLGKKDPMTALLEFKREAKSKLPIAAYNEMLKAGHFSPGNFKRQYEEQIKSFVPLIERKLLTYQEINHLSDDKIQELLGKNKTLQRFFLDYSENPDIRSLSIPDRTWGEWYNQKFGEGIPGALTAATTAGFGTLGTYGVAKSAKPLYQGVARAFGANPNYTQAQLSKMADATKGKIGTGYDKTAAKNVSKSKGILTKAENAYKKADKAYKGKKFSMTKDGKKMKTSIDAAKKTLTKNTSKIGKGSMQVIQRYIKQHGTSGLIKAIGKKFGTMGAIRIAAQLGGGTLLSGTGIGTAVGVGLNAITLWQIANMIGDLTE